VCAGVVLGDGRGDVLEDRRLAGLGGRHDQPALALADGRDEVDDPRRDCLRVVALELELLVRVDRREVAEVLALLGLVRFEPVHRGDLDERRVLLVVLGRADGPLHHVAAPELEATDLRHRAVDVVIPGQVAARADETVAFRENVEDADDVDVALGLHLGLVDRLDDLVLLLQRLDVELDLGSHLPELGHRLLRQLLPGYGWATILMASSPAATAAASLAWTCTHEFFTFSQSARNASRPRSVRGCFTSFCSTANGTVAMSAPISAAATTCWLCRTEAAMTSTGWWKS